MIQPTPPLPGTVPDPLYPDSDGKPMGETDFHINALIWLREGLQDFFALIVDVYVASDMFWYFERGNPRANVCPDVMVIRGVCKHNRRSFRSWEEHASPCVIIELASEDTWQTDLDDKRQLYARLRVREYFVFDPELRYLTPSFQGFRLRRGVLVPMRLAEDGGLTSQELGLRLVPEGHMLRLRNAQTGRRVLTRAEQAERQRQRVRRQQQRNRDLQAEVDRLRQLLQQPQGPGPDTGGGANG